MGRTISNDLKYRIVLTYEVDHLTMEEIATKQRVSIGLVSKVVRLHRLYGQVTDPLVHHAGRPSFLEHDDLEYLSAILDANPGLYLLKRNIGRCYSDLKPNVPLRNCIGSLRSQDLCK